MSLTSLNFIRITACFACVLALSGARPSHAKKPAQSCSQQVIVPGEDRFFPFALTIRAGDCVEWVNQDTDDHTVVSDDPFNTAGNKGTDHLLPGTDSNGGQPGTFVLRFNKRHLRLLLPISFSPRWRQSAGRSRPGRRHSGRERQFRNTDDGSRYREISRWERRLRTDRPLGDRRAQGFRYLSRSLGP